MIVEEPKGSEKPKNEIPWNIINKYNEGENIAPGPRIRARCIDPRGIFYRHNRIRENEEFFIYPVYRAKMKKDGKPEKKGRQVQLEIVTARQQFSENTMEFIDEGEDLGGFERFTSAQDALNKAVTDLKNDSIGTPVIMEDSEPKRGPGRPPKNA